MKLSHELGKIFESEMDKVIQKERENPDFLPHKYFETCEGRAFVGVAMATPKVVKMLALAICSHREIEHNENHKEEIKRLNMALSSEEVEASIKSWWSN